MLRIVTPGYKKTEQYIWGLAWQIQGMVTTSRPTTFDSAKSLAFNLTNQEIHQGTMVHKDGTTKTGDHKRKYDDESRGHLVQSSWKGRDTRKVYVTIIAPQK